MSINIHLFIYLFYIDGNRKQLSPPAIDRGVLLFLLLLLFGTIHEVMAIIFFFLSKKDLQLLQLNFDCFYILM